MPRRSACRLITLSSVSSLPRVSVLLPCRNGEDTLDDALTSLVEQTIDDFEIVLVDDGSDDRTPELLDMWAARESRIRVIRTPPGGIVSALNLAAESAKGDLLARMDADDIALPERLMRQAELLDTSLDVAACGTLVRYFPRSQVRDGALRYEAWINSVVTGAEIERDLFVECPIPHPSLMMRRIAFDAVGGYTEAGWPEDYDLILRLWDAGFRFGKVAESLLEWREAPDRLSRNDVRYSEAAFRRCKARYIGKRIAGRKVVVCGAGPVGKAFAVALKEEGHEVAAFVDLDPRKIGQTVHGARVYHPERIGEFRDCYAVAAVGSEKGRMEIREMFLQAGLSEPEQCCAVA